MLQGQRCALRAPARPTLPSAKTHKNTEQETTISSRAAPVRRLHVRVRVPVRVHASHARIPWTWSMKLKSHGHAAPVVALYMAPIRTGTLKVKDEPGP